MTFYEDLLAALEDKKIRYLIVGGVAVVLHGFIRATVDLDLMIGLDPENVNAFLSLMKERGYKPKAPVALEDFSSLKNRQMWTAEKNMIVFSMFHPQRSQELVDVFINDPIPFNEAYSRRVMIPTGQHQLAVASAEDLITLKQRAGRKQDLQDIEALKKVKK